MVNGVMVINRYKVILDLFFLLVVVKNSVFVSVIVIVELIVKFVIIG